MNMKLKTLKIYIGSLLALLISLSLTVSTLHSHNHIEWHHPKKHVNTGTCLIVDSTDCPICGYLFHVHVTAPETTEVPIYDTTILVDSSFFLIQGPNLYLHSGRSPPVLI